MTRRTKFFAECVAAVFVLLLLFAVCAYLYTAMFCVVVTNRSAEDLTEVHVALPGALLWDGALPAHGRKILFGFPGAEGTGVFSFAAGNAKPVRQILGYMSPYVAENIFIEVRPSLRVAVRFETRAR